ncbi:MAG: hypothetical protein HY046_14710 [Acidobacteria bacterium]|nr:hypothetical protein [Acidobacteriota bacterium]
MRQWFGRVALLFTLACPFLSVQSQEPPPQEKPKQLTSEKAAPVDQDAAPKPRVPKTLVPSGTKIPLVLHNAISTRSAKNGDPVYLETLFPVAIDSKVVIPAGSYVSGQILEAKRPGKVSGRGELSIQLNMLIMPNGYTVNFNAVPTGAGTGGNEKVDEEGRVKGDSDKGGDVGGAVTTTLEGAAVGSVIGAAAGNARRGGVIGLGAGAAMGLLTVLLTRGPDIEMPRGTSLDIVLNRPLYLDTDKVQFTDPGRASSLSGPPNRQPQRRRWPY